MSKFWKYFGILVAVIILLLGFFYFRFKPTKNPEWGLTFSYQEAQGLGFDWRTAYLDMLDDLKPKNLRLMTYWNDIEKEKGKYDFTIADEMLTEAQKRDLDVVLVIGRKQPRWPECHEPSWYKDLQPSDQDQAVLDFVKSSVDHFKTFSVIKTWQVENEPFFGFGPDCPKSSQQFFNQEVSLVKSLDSRPVLVTDSGDRGGWFGAAKSGAEIFGATFYRVSYDSKFGGYYKYPLPSSFYRVRAGILQTFVHTPSVWDIELQMEPWFTNGALNMPIGEQKALMNPKVFEENINYAENTGFEKHYLWGVEWWYWMAKKNNDWGMWQAAKNLLSS
jgi:hypothetical protein